MAKCGIPKSSVVEVSSSCVSDDRDCVVRFNRIMLKKYPAGREANKLPKIGMDEN